MATHSRVIAPHLKDSLSMADAGKYGRMFPGLPSPETDENILLYLGEGRAPLWMPQPLWFYILKEPRSAITARD